MNIILPSTEMYCKPSKDSELETECLFGETVEVLDIFSDWVYCKLLTDNYLGWIKKESLGVLKLATHRVICSRTLVFSKNNEKSSLINYLPMGSRLSVKKIINNWAEVFLSKDQKFKLAYVPSNHIILKDEKVTDWVVYAENLINTPYKWGGRSFLGIDCSALLQLSYQMYGKNIPRNSNNQCEIINDVLFDTKKVERGHVIFWDGHVGIMVNKLNCIHANAYRMTTCIEPLTNIIKRMKSSKIIKMVNFN